MTTTTKYYAAVRFQSPPNSPLGEWAPLSGALALKVGEFIGSKPILRARVGDAWADVNRATRALSQPPVLESQALRDYEFTVLKHETRGPPRFHPQVRQRIGDGSWWNLAVDGRPGAFCDTGATEDPIPVSLEAAAERIRDALDSLPGSAFERSYQFRIVPAE